MTILTDCILVLNFQLLKLSGCVLSISPRLYEFLLHLADLMLLKLVALHLVGIHSGLLLIDFLNLGLECPFIKLFSQGNTDV